MKMLKGCVVLLGLVLATSSRATPDLTNARSLSRYYQLTYRFSTTSSISGALVGTLPQAGMVLRDVVVAQAGAGVGGTSWTATPKRGGTALVSTPGGFTLAAGASKATNFASSPVNMLGLPSGGTRPVLKGSVVATQTVTVGTLSAGNAVTIGGITFTARSSGETFPDFNIGATPTDSATALAAAINGHTGAPVTASSAAAVVTLTSKFSGAGGNAIALSQTANYTLGAGTLAGGFDRQSAAGDIITMDVTLTGTYSGAVSGIVQLYFEPQW